MQEAEGLVFQASGPELWIGLLLVLILGWLGLTAWNRSGRKGSAALMEGFRLLLALLVWSSLCGPEWRAVQSRKERNTLVVLHDRSASMEIADVDADGGLASRASSIEPLLAREVWEPEEGELEVVLEPFSSETGEGATDIHGALSRVLESHEGLRGVVLLSDGDWNEGLPPSGAAARYRMKGVPVFPVGAGSEVPLPDLSLEEMNAPTYCVSGKPVRIPYAVRSSLGQDQEVAVTLSVDGAASLIRQVRVPAMALFQDSLVWEPLAIGDFRLSLEVESVAADRVPDNNRREVPVSVRREALRVLVVESVPRWEYRYLRNALERDPGVDLGCLLFHPHLGGQGDGPGYRQRFPSPEELNGFDVCFLGDVGMTTGQLTMEETRHLRQWVGTQAAGLVFLPGRYGWQETLRESALFDLLPVEPDASRPMGVGANRPGHFVLTESGRSSLLTRLTDSADENVRIWRRLPGFHWHAGVVRARIGSEVLAVHDWRTTSGGRLPLIVTRTHGTGKVLFMGTDGAWRWREGVEDRYHYRFWGQVARWMAYQRQKAKGESMRLFCSPDHPRVGTRVALHANVLDAVGNLLEQGEVEVGIRAPSGRGHAVRLEPGEGEARGLFTGYFEPGEPGLHILEAHCPEVGAAASAELTVQGSDRERQGRIARHDVLGEIAALTGGRLTPLTEASGLPAFIHALPEPREDLRRIRLWAHPIWWGTLTVLLGIFWYLRKRTSMI